ncbi:hypothetical protein [Roseateles sp. MS654]|uniref:hypothetical protein n=1 Tax=Roseateles sp. MS654 TaxID=3412685 RepID=UPI003C2C675E
MRLQQIATEHHDWVRMKMTPSEIFGLNAGLDVFAAGIVEWARPTRCIDGAPGDSALLMPAVELAVRDSSTDELHVRVIPASRLTDVRVGQKVRMYVSRSGWARHILTWHVVPAVLT